MKIIFLFYNKTFNFIIYNLIELNIPNSIFFLLYDPIIDSNKYYILIINVLLTNFMSIVTIIPNGDFFRFFNNNQKSERENKREEELHLRWVEIVEHRR